MRTYTYNDGTIRTGKRGNYMLTKVYNDGETVTARELQPAPFQRNKSFNQRAWIVTRSSNPNVIELWSYNTLVMEFDTRANRFAYLDGYAPFGKYRSQYIERRDHETRYNSVTTRLHETAFLYQWGGMDEDHEDFDVFETFSTYLQMPHTFCRHDSITNDYVTQTMQ